jgi:hypothetical protein
MSATISETDEERAARLEAEQAALDAGGELDADGRDFPEGAADDGDNVGSQQDGLFDQVVEDEELEAVLDEREKLRQKKLAATKAYKERHDVAKGKLDALDLPDDSTVRCGRHRITVKRSAARHVSFDTGGQRTLRIFPIGDD